MKIENTYKEFDEDMFIRGMSEACGELDVIAKYLNSGILPKSISGSGYYFEDPRIIKQLFDEIISDLKK